MDEPLDFSAEIERFEMKGARSFMALPEAIWAQLNDAMMPFALLGLLGPKAN